MLGQSLILLNSQPEVEISKDGNENATSTLQILIGMMTLSFVEAALQSYFGMLNQILQISCN
jgi:hypothetical protein